jgi:hypothetical protein
MSVMDGMRGHVSVCRHCCGGFPVAVRGSPGSGVVYATLAAASRRCGVTIASARAGIGGVRGYLTVVMRVRGDV